MKKVVCICLIMAIFIIGCEIEKKENELNCSKWEIYSIPPHTDLFNYISQQDYNIEFLREIISEEIINESNEDTISLAMLRCTDSLNVIDQAKIKLANTSFELTKTASDTTGYIVRIEKSIQPGGSIYQVLTDLGMPQKDVGYNAWQMGEYIDATSIDVGDRFSVSYYITADSTKHFEKFTYQADKLSIHEFYLQEERQLEYRLVELPYELRRRLVTGSITEDYPTWDDAMNALGIIPYIRQQANNAMESQIAFSTDARIGDEFKVYIEEIYVNEELQPRGKLLYANYSGKFTKNRSAYRFTDSDPASAFTGMYTAKAKRLVTDAVRTPLDRMHITSPFGYRIHPIYGTRRMHTGIDLRGSYGTPVYAVTSGVVTKATNSGNGYGNEVLIKHSNGMITQYAHLSKISTRKWKKVKKGQLIGKVGSTGVSTGPHLHFGLKKNGRWINPKTNLKMVGANTLKGNRLTAFNKQMKALENEIKAQKKG